MDAYSYSPFLQALGWAALNSIWQTGLSWCLFITANHLFKLSPQRRYLLSITGIGISFLLFCGNIFYFLYFGAELQQNFSNFETPYLRGWMPAILTSASVTYLLLLSIPIYRLYNNWRFLRRLQKLQVQKTSIDYKLFVQKMSAVLGIKKKVSLYVSAFIQSPVTIGYLKPIILLPIASLNHLTVSQAEAVLLHELSHIRRYDYLVNIFISIIHTILYFNPFVRLFQLMAENSREECCDQLVLQFGYDKINYASALLNLEKATAKNPVFAIGATGKSNFVQRIEKIVGLSPDKQPFKFSHVAGFLAALIFVFFMHAFFTAIQQKHEGHQLAFNNFANPFNFPINFDDEAEANHQPSAKPVDSKIISISKQAACTEEEAIINETVYPVEQTTFNSNIIPVALNEVDAHLTAEQKNKVESTIKTAKNVLINYEWNQLESTIPDDLTTEEKNQAQQEYLAEVNNINWNNLENNLKASYEKVNWDLIELNLKNIKVKEQLDSLKNQYQIVIRQIEKVETNGKVLILPFPDESVHKMELLKKEISNKLDTLQAADKKVIKL